VEPDYSRSGQNFKHSLPDPLLTLLEFSPNVDRGIFVPPSPAGNTFTGVKVASKRSEAASLETIALAHRMDLSSETTASTSGSVLLALLPAYQILQLYRVLINYKYLTKIKGTNQFR
jgi:hypothetical protein